jgi:hypothetical protein
VALPTVALRMFSSVASLTRSGSLDGGNSPACTMIVRSFGTRMYSGSDRSHASACGVSDAATAAM